MKRWLEHRYSKQEVIGSLLERGNTRTFESKLITFNITYYPEFEMLEACWRNFKFC